MKTQTAINRTKNAIEKHKNNIKKLAQDYINVSNINLSRERRVFVTMRSEKREKNKLEQLLKKLERKKKTMKEMVWKKDKTLEENIKENLK